MKILLFLATSLVGTQAFHTRFGLHGNSVPERAAPAARPVGTRPDVMFSLDVPIVVSDANIVVT